MRGLQDSFAQVHQGLGLERGIKGSKANHTTVKEFYAHANAFAEAPSLDISLTPSQASIQAPQTDFFGRMKETPDDYKEAQEKRLNAQVEAQQKKALEKAKEKMVELHQAAKAAEVIRKENEKLKGEMKGLQNQAKDLNGKLGQISEKLTQQTNQAGILIKDIILNEISKQELVQAISTIPDRSDKKQERIRDLLTGIGIPVKQVQVEQKEEIKVSKGVRLR